MERAAQLVQALIDYSHVIGPWAESVASLMLADVARRDRAMWRKNSEDLGQRLRYQLDNAPVGEALRALQAQQVELIKSIPREAADRVQRLAQESITTGGRAQELAAQIMRTEEVSRSRAALIARTEVARAQSNLVQVRSQAVGSEGYIWRTSGDGDVRDSHREMEGKYVRWGQPPTLDGLTGHAGTLPNCRCFAEPILPDL